jgi:ATP citrate (pro-S)-lyase
MDLNDDMDPNLFSRNTQAIFYNLKEAPIQRMLDFDYLCKRETPSVAAVVSPSAEGGTHKAFFGTREVLLRVYGTIDAATTAHPNASVFINFASSRSAYASSMTALRSPTIRVVVIIAEGVPENEARSLVRVAKEMKKVVIGPATVGGIQAGAFRIGNTAGTIDNILACKLYRPGSIGFVSKSGGLSNEMYNVLARTTNGIYEGIAIGGDAFPGSNFLDHILRFEKIPQVKMIVILGELGGWEECRICEALKSGKVTKPLCAWVSGTVAKMFPTEVQFGHAGAKSGNQSESADAKNQALRDAGAFVPQSFDTFADIISSVYQRLVSQGVIIPQPEPQIPEFPQDFKTAAKAGKVRRPTSIVSTICDDRGDEPTYAGIPISGVITEGLGMGDVIGLLWLRRRLPKYAARFIEMCLVLVADHGPCVSGAHNTIVASRAGKDLVSSVASGLLTIGPRFGGAIDDAARSFKDAVDRNLTPEGFVEGMKAMGRYIPGIGHRIKNRDNPDLRVVLLKDYATRNFTSRRYLDYALAVEQYTLQKAPNLILNVDGAIAVLFLDMMYSCGDFPEAQIKDVVDIGYLNGLFVIGRSIGLVGHALDQKRLKQPLYRHPWEDVLYDVSSDC